MAFEVAFQEKVLACLISHPNFFAQVCLHAEAQFDTPEMKYLWSKIKDSYLNYKTPPTATMLRREIHKDSKDDCLPILERILRLPEDWRYVESEFVSFLRHQAIKDALLKSVDLLEKQRWDDIESLVKDAFNVGREDGNLGSRYFRETRQRAASRVFREKEKVGTLIPQLDAVLDGGVSVPDLCVIMGLYSSGKSMMLINILKGAVLQGLPSVYYTAEMSADQVADRFDASFSGININDLVEKPEVLIPKIEKVKRLFGDLLIIKEFPARKWKVETFESHLNLLDQFGFHAKVVGIDYADLIAPSHLYNSPYIELRTIYEELKGLASERQLIIWTPTQAHRQASHKETLDGEDIADSFQKVMVPDVVLSINQTKSEEMQNKLRLFVVKNRFNKRHQQITLSTDFARAQFAKLEPD